MFEFAASLHSFHKDSRVCSLFEGTDFLLVFVLPRKYTRALAGL